MSSAGRIGRDSDRLRGMIAAYGHCGLALALIICVWAAAATSCQADEGLDVYRTAVGYYNKEEWKLAAENFQAFLKNHGQHPRVENARFYYGLTLVKLDNFKQARDVLRAFVKDYPRSRERTVAGYWIGHACYFLDDFAGAEVELSRFLESAADDPLREWALPYLADSELRLKKAEAAARHFQQALDAFPQGEMSEDARFGLARCLEQQQKIPEAVAAYQAVAANRAGARAADAQLNLGDLYFDSGDFAAAVTAFEAFEQHFPQSPQLAQAQFNCGSACYQLKNYKAAVAAFEKAARGEKFAVEAQFWTGLSWKAQGDWQQAGAVFQKTYAAHQDHVLAEKLLFQWAQCEDRRGERVRARELYLDLVNRFPKGALSGDSLYAATVVALELGQFVDAEQLLTRFDRDYPGSALRLRQQILRGRLRMLRPEHDYAGAAKIFQTVIAETEKDGTRQQARYYLGYALQGLGQHAQVLEATEPLVGQLGKDASLTDYAGICVVRAESQRALARAALTGARPGDPALEEVNRLAAQAVASVGTYLQLAPEGPLASQALAIAAIAEGLAAHRDAALEYLGDLRRRYPESADRDRALLELGRQAFAREDYPLAEQLYGELAARPRSASHAEALVDLGWSLHRQKKFGDAAAAFGRLITEHPGDRLVPEAAFQRGIALSDAGRASEAQAALAEAARLPGDAKEIFLAGWQSARLLGRLKKLVEADAAFDAVLKRFPKAGEADKVLNEWAALHYDHERYARGDEILRRLVQEYPASPLAGNARLSLAESDLIAGRTDQARSQFIALASATVEAGAGTPPATEQKRALEQSQLLQQRALYQLIQIELGAGRWEGVRKYCEESRQRFPEGTYADENDVAWAEADFRLGNYKLAQERLLKLKARKAEPALRQAVWFSQVWVMLAEIDWRQKAYDAVAATVQEFQEWNPQSPLLYQAQEVLGRSLKSQGKYPEAREVLTRVLNDPQARDTETAAKSQFLIADTYYWEKNYTAAYENFLKVEILYQYPDLQAAALYQAGVCQEELQGWKKAARSYDEMLQKYPASEHAAKARERLEIVRKRITSG